MAKNPPTTPTLDLGETPSNEPVKFARIQLEDITVQEAINPRATFEGIEELAESLAERGQLQPILVRPTPTDSNLGYSSLYLLVAGERRYRAAQMLGWTHIDATIKTIEGSPEASMTALIENTQRKDLNPIEKAKAYSLLAMPPYNYSQERIGKLAGVSQEIVSRTIGLLKTHWRVQLAIVEGRLSESHGAEFIRISDDLPMQTALLDAAIDNDMSVSLLRKQISALLNGKQEEARQASPALPLGTDDVEAAKTSDATTHKGERVVGLADMTVVDANGVHKPGDSTHPVTVATNTALPHPERAAQDRAANAEGYRDATSPVVGSDVEWVGDGKVREPKRDGMVSLTVTFARVVNGVERGESFPLGRSQLDQLETILRVKKHHFMYQIFHELIMDAIIDSSNSPLPKAVGLWADETFPQSTAESVINHLKREIIELEEAVKNPTSFNIQQEAADCQILLWHLAHKCHFNINEEAADKHRVNKHRKWGKPDAEGVVEHVDDETPAVKNESDDCIGDEEVFKDAARFVVRKFKRGNLHTAIQLKFKFGFSYACKIVDMLEERGVVSKTDGVGVLKVTMTSGQLEAMLSQPAIVTTSPIPKIVMPKESWKSVPIGGNEATCGFVREPVPHDGDFYAPTYYYSGGGHRPSVIMAHLMVVREKYRGIIREHDSTSGLNEGASCVNVNSVSSTRDPYYTEFEFEGVPVWYAGKTFVLTGEAVHLVSDEENEKWGTGGTPQNPVVSTPLSAYISPSYTSRKVFPERFTEYDLALLRKFDKLSTGEKSKPIQTIVVLGTEYLVVAKLASGSLLCVELREKTETGGSADADNEHWWSPDCELEGLILVGRCDKQYVCTGKLMCLWTDGSPVVPEKALSESNAPIETVSESESVQETMPSDTAVSKPKNRTKKTTPTKIPSPMKYYVSEFVVDESTAVANTLCWDFEGYVTGENPLQGTFFTSPHIFSEEYSVAENNDPVRWETSHMDVAIGVAERGAAIRPRHCFAVNHGNEDEGFTALWFAHGDGLTSVWPPLPDKAEKPSELEELPSINPRDTNPHRLAFVAALKHYRHADEAFLAKYAKDPEEADRMANHLLRGISSKSPLMTAARWGEARQILKEDDPNPENPKALDAAFPEVPDNK